MDNSKPQSENKIENSSGDDTSLLVVIFDSNPGQNLLRNNPHMLTHCLDSIIAFSNSHLMQKAHNKLAVVACHSRKSDFIYPGAGKPLDLRQIDGQYETFTLVEKTIKKNLAKHLASESSVLNTESLLAGAIAMALCYIARLQRLTFAGCKVYVLNYYTQLIA